MNVTTRELKDRKKADRRGWDLHDFPQQMEASQSDTQQWGYTWRRETGHNCTCGHQERPLSCQPCWHRGPVGPCQPGAGMCQSTWQTNQHWNDVWNTLTAVIRDITHTHTHTLRAEVQNHSDRVHITDICSLSTCAQLWLKWKTCFTMDYGYWSPWLTAVRRSVTSCQRGFWIIKIVIPINWIQHTEAISWNYLKYF